MDQNKIETTKDEITFVDILRMFRGKVKLLMCVALIVAVLGATVGVLVAEIDVVYGAQITFYLLPGESTQTLLPILKSEAFAEKLLLDENGLPPRAECDPADYDAALAAVQAENEARKNKLEISREMASYPYKLAIIEAQYNVLNNEQIRISELLKTYKSAQDEIAKQPDHLTKIAEYEQKLAEAEQAWQDYKTNVYDPAIEYKLEINQKNHLISRALNDARKLADELVEKVVSTWREKEEVRTLVATIQDSVTYEYTKILDNSAADQKVENQNTSFLVISVAVPQNDEVAQQIVEMIKERTPSFVEKEVERLTGVAEANCTLTSTFVESSEIGDTSPIKNAIIFAAVGAVAAIAVACVVIIVYNLLPEDLRPAKKEKKNKKAADKAQ